MPIHLQDTQKVAIPPVDLAYAESRVDTTLKYTLQLLFEANTTLKYICCLKPIPNQRYVIWSSHELLVYDGTNQARVSAVI